MNKWLISLLLIFQITIVSNLQGQKEYDDNIHVLIIEGNKLIHSIYKDYGYKERSIISSELFDIYIENYPMLEYGISYDMVIMYTYVHMTYIKEKHGNELYIYIPDNHSMFNGKKHPDVFYNKKLKKGNPIIK